MTRYHECDEHCAACPKCYQAENREVCRLLCRHAVCPECESGSFTPTRGCQDCGQGPLLAPGFVIFDGTMYLQRTPYDGSWAYLSSLERYATVVTRALAEALASEFNGKVAPSVYGRPPERSER